MSVAVWSGSLVAWERELVALKERIGPVFGRAEVRATAGAFLDGVLSGVARKTGWLLAEQAGQGRRAGGGCLRDQTSDGLRVDRPGARCWCTLCLGSGGRPVWDRLAAATHAGEAGAALRARGALQPLPALLDRGGAGGDRPRDDGRCPGEGCLGHARGRRGLEGAATVRMGADRAVLTRGSGLRALAPDPSQPARARQTGLLFCLCAGWCLAGRTGRRGGAALDD